MDNMERIKDNIGKLLFNKKGGASGHYREVARLTKKLRELENKGYNNEN